MNQKSTDSYEEICLLKEIHWVHWKENPWIVTYKVIDKGLVSLFDGISNFMGYLMPNPTMEKKNSGTI